MIEKFDSSKERIIQEFVPGKQITLAHIIPNPVSDLYSKMGMIDGDGAIGIFTITPSEGAIIAADVASKAGGIKIGFVDRFNGTLIITGEVASVEAAMNQPLQSQKEDSNMKTKIILIGRSMAGKTTLCQYLTNEELRYKKTQTIQVINKTMVDTPGEYFEHRFWGALSVTAAEVDCIVLVQQSTESGTMFPPALYRR